MNKTFVLATGNPGKVRELRELLEEAGWDCVSAKELGVNLEAPENAETLEGNARIKAREVFQKTGRASFSDDTGLFVDALGGLPGVHTARFAGDACDRNANIDKLLRELEGVPDAKRTARFRCSVCAILPDGAELHAEGVLEGRIAHARCGEDGFGYDPVFLLPDGRSLAQTEEHEKNRLSHRYLAVRAMLELLSK